MSSGENIGYSTRLTQNNSSLYFGSTLGSGLNRMITINLMGDPSLRTHYIRPPSNLVAVNNNGDAVLNWAASPDAVLGYNVYRRFTDSTSFVKVNSSIITSNSFTDTTLPFAGTVIYYVKAVDLHVSPTASYYNQSLAISDTAFFNVGIENPVGHTQIHIYPNPAENQFTLLIISAAFANGGLQIIDMAGRQVLSTNVNSTRETINVSMLNAGVYTLLLQTNKARLVKRLVIK
jgi:hypothetical protein